MIFLLNQWRSKIKNQEEETMGQSTRKYDLINDFNNLKKTGGFDSGGGVGYFTFWQNFISNLQEH